MKKISAGILLFQRAPDGNKILIVHPGGPFYVKKDAGAWSIPKGEAAQGEDLEETARREFREELGFEPVGALIPLGNVQMKSGKIVHAWAIDATGSAIDLANFKSNTFELEWPPRSGRFQEFPEIDRAEFVALDVARAKLNPALVGFLERMEQAIGLS